MGLVSVCNECEDKEAEGVGCTDGIKVAFRATFKSHPMAILLLQPSSLLPSSDFLTLFHISAPPPPPNNLLS